VRNLLFFFYPTNHYFEVSFTTLTDNAILIFLASSFSLITCSGLHTARKKRLKTAIQVAQGFAISVKTPLALKTMFLSTPKKTRPKKAFIF